MMAVATFRRILLMGLILYAAWGLQAEAAEPGFLSLWGDEAMTSCEFHTQNPYVIFQLYVFIEPGSEGAYGAEYKLSGGNNHIAVETTISPVVGWRLGDWLNGYGISAWFVTCQVEPFWIVMFDILPISVDPGYFMIVPHDDTGGLGMFDCISVPEIYGEVYNQFGFNTGCLVGTKESSWGAVKSQFTRNPD